MKYNLILLLSILLALSACKKDSDPIVPVDDPLSGSIKVIHDEFESVPLVIIGNPSHNYIVAYESTLPDGTILEFEPKQRALPAVLKDQEGNVWDIQGLAIEGPREGQRLVGTNSYIGFWFAWGTMYPGIELYDGTTYTGNFQQSSPEQDWTIPTQTVFNVLGIDAIPAIDQPVFETYDEKEAIDNGFFLDDDDMVVGVTINSTTHLYPIRILNWHEIVNDEIDGQYFSASFCPVTGTAVMWDRTIDGQVTTFGVSGLLYSGNVMPYDRNTVSIWSQMRQGCVTGPLIGQAMNTTQVLETSWRTWKQIFESPDVLTTDTGFPKDYEVNPYEGYINNQEVLAYPVEYHDTRLPNKERVLGLVINGNAKAYQFKDFED